jgi:hypothetical protein
VPDYAEARRSRFTAAATTQIAGVPVTIPENQAINSGYTPIQLCQCVTEPCDCSGPIVWIPTEDIHGDTETERRNGAGEQVHEFQINPDAAVLVESIQRVNLSSLALLKDSHRRLASRDARPPGRPCGCGSAVESDRPGVSGVYVDQVCSAGTTYDVYQDVYRGETIFHYVAVGSCSS